MSAAEQKGGGRCGADRWHIARHRCVAQGKEKERWSNSKATGGYQSVKAMTRAGGSGAVRCTVRCT